MKTFLLLFIASLTVQFSFAQEIQFEKDALPAVLAKAKKMEKPVFILIEGPPRSTATLSAEARKATIESGLYDPAVTTILNKDFLNFKVPYRSAVSRQLRKQYSVNQFPTYLYLNPDGSLIYRQGSTTTSVRRYLNDIEEFKKRSAGSQNLSNFKKAYEEGRRDAAFLKNYIQELNNLGLMVEQELLQNYVNALPAKAFDAFSEVVFIHQQGPIVDSKAYKLARLHQTLVDSLYKTLPLPERIKINNLIIRNTMEKAIAEKDRDLAFKGATFARNSHSDDHERGQRTFQNNLMRFYGSTGDTANYLQQMVSYVDHYYMSVPEDSLKKMLAADSAALAASRARAEQIRQAISEKDNVVVQQRAVVRMGTHSAVGLEHLSVLNNSAYAIYRSGTKNNRYLTRALAWSKRTVDVAPNFAHYDTLAHLLYKLAFYFEAEAMQLKAVEMAQEEKTNLKHLQQELSKMKSRTL